MAEGIIIDKIQFKRGKTAKLAVWATIPAIGEPIYDYELNKLKIGDGVHTYADLPYFGESGTTEQIIFNTKALFPNQGIENKLYIAKDENNAYIWKNNQYEVISVEHDVLDDLILDGGNAADWEE